MDVQRKMREKAMKYRSDRYTQSLEAAIAVIYRPVQKLKSLWKDIHKDLVKRTRSGELTTEQLNYEMDRINEGIVKPLEDLVELSNAFAEAFASQSQTGRIDADALLKMVKSKHLNIMRMTALYMEKNPRFLGMKGAVKWTLDIPYVEDKGGKHSLEAGKKKAFAELMDKFDNNRHDERMVRYAWFALGMLSHKNEAMLIDFTVQYFADKDPQFAMGFLEEGNKRGIFSPGQMQTILEASKMINAVGEKVSANKEKYSTLWEAQNDFQKRAYQMVHKNYQAGMEGGKDLASRKITLANTLKFGGYLVALGSGIGNTLVEFIEGGDFTFSMDRLKNALTKKYTLLSAGYIAWYHHSTKKDGVPLMDKLTKTGSETKRQSLYYLSRELKNANNTRWGDYFAADNQKGLIRLSRWLDQKHLLDKNGNLIPEAINFRDFKEDLEKEGGPLATAIQKVPTDPIQFRTICLALDAHNVGGADREITDNFTKALKISQGDA